MARLKKGTKLVCQPCGRQVSVDCCGVSETTIWCCGRPMKNKNKAKSSQKK
jgi:hypothetical protein